MTARHHDGTDGVVAAVAVGPGKPDQRKTWAWEIDYTFGYVEKLAINASYAQDDWVRWGSGSQTDSSDFRGHEAGLRYWLTEAVDVHARFYSVEAITTRQDGLRFRIDLNYKF